MAGGPSGPPRILGGPWVLQEKNGDGAMEGEVTASCVRNGLVHISENRRNDGIAKFINTIYIIYTLGFFFITLYMQIYKKRNNT